MRIRVFALRTAREILRDPMSLVFGLGFPLILLCLMTVIQKNIPVPMFALTELTPGITAFGMSFLCLFAAVLVAKDRSGCLMDRLRATPMRSLDFFLGYLLPMLPAALLQSAAVYLAAVLLGLRPSGWIVPAILAQLPMAVFYISGGILCGCVMTERQVGGFCGALLTNLGAWLSGAWFDLSLLGGAFEKLARLLPFANAVEAGRTLLADGWSGVWRPFAVTCIYAALMTAAAYTVTGRLTQAK